MGHTIASRVGAIIGTLPTSLIAPIWVTVVTAPCMMCGHMGTLSIPKHGLDRYMSGEYAQDAFPTLASSEREQLISGIHPACWEELYGTEDD